MRAILGGLGRRIPRPTPAMGVALLALLIACSGAAFATVPSDDGTITACRDNRTGVLRAIDAESNQTCRVTETLLSWKDGINGKVADALHADQADTAASAGDANTLDGKDSTEFLGKTEKVADSDKLDGVDSSGFAGSGKTVYELNEFVPQCSRNEVLANIPFSVTRESLVYASADVAYSANGTEAGDPSINVFLIGPTLSDLTPVADGGFTRTRTHDLFDARTLSLDGVLRSGPSVYDPSSVPFVATPGNNYHLVLTIDTDGVCSGTQNQGFVEAHNLSYILLGKQ